MTRFTSRATASILPIGATNAADRRLMLRRMNEGAETAH